MRVALVNPAWRFDGSIYFGCREPHLPLEYGYAKALLERAGHEAVIVDGQLDGLSREEINRQVAAFTPDLAVVTTAPSYLFWRCAPPELRVPQELVADLRPLVDAVVAVGPHGSTTPGSALRKLGVDAVVMGECEDILPLLAGPWKDVPSLCWRDGDRVRVQGGPHATDMQMLPALDWPDDSVRRHVHHHHRFEAQPQGPGAEMEASRGCPYHCTFCAKDNFRNLYRKRPVETVLRELDGLLAQGVEYVYFIDEIFLPDRALLAGLADRPVKIGIQTRIDLWSHDMIDWLGRAHCVSIEAGVESVSSEGRDYLDKKCRMDNDQLSERLIYAKQRVPFVQANLLSMPEDDPAVIESWREHLLAHGVWANKPVPLFPYPGSPEYTRKWGAPDDLAWERAHEYYLTGHDSFSDIQEQRPLPLVQLELSAANEC